MFSRYALGQSFVPTQKGGGPAPSDIGGGLLNEALSAAWLDKA